MLCFYNATLCQVFLHIFFYWIEKRNGYRCALEHSVSSDAKIMMRDLLYTSYDEGTHYIPVKMRGPIIQQL